MPSSHAIPFIGLLPLATAGFAALIGQDRPRPLFWLFAVLGSALVAGHAWLSGGLTFEAADLLMLAAIVTCGMGYAVGGKLTRRLGSLAVISWALVLSLPVSAVATVALWPANLAATPASAWAGFAYVSVFSMFVGFLFWYRGLALGGAARVGQLQLLQTFAGLGLAALLLGEAVAWSTWAVAAGRGSAACSRRAARPECNGTCCGGAGLKCRISALRGKAPCQYGPARLSTNRTESDHGLHRRASGPHQAVAHHRRHQQGARAEGGRARRHRPRRRRAGFRHAGQHQGRRRSRRSRPATPNTPTSTAPPR